MKVLTVLGTRPEIIRLSAVVPRLDDTCGPGGHVLVHTGQNFTASLSDVFFDELGVRTPDHHLTLRGSGFAARIGEMMAALAQVYDAERPDRVLVLGDTDSAVASTFVAKRMGIPVFHMEAGNRCFDDRVPEEVNRRVVDHASDVLLPYTERSRDNLLREGVGPERVLVTGNPINEVLLRHAERIQGSDVHARLGLARGGYVLMTMHRQETVDHEDRLRSLVSGAVAVAAELGLPVIVSVHPRTRARLEEFGLTPSDGRLVLCEPFGFFDFVALEQNARCVLSDSGTVQEECCILGVPAVTLRDTTERPETVECGSNVISGVEPGAVLRCLRVVLADPPRWTPPPEYVVPDVSSTVTRILLGR